MAQDGLYGDQSLASVVTRRFFFAVWSVLVFFFSVVFFEFFFIFDIRLLDLKLYNFILYLFYGFFNLIF